MALNLPRMLALALEEERRAKLANASLLEFIPLVSPQYDAPSHIADFAHWIERTETEEVRLLVSMPPQHYKTQTAIHGLIRMLLRVPGKENMYITYSHERATFVQEQALPIAKAAGLELVKQNQIYWRASNGSVLHWLGVGGSITGKPVSGVIFIDDLYKNMLQARSAAQRVMVEITWGSAIWPRIHPGGSIIALGTRWTIDDFFAEREQTIFPSGKQFTVINYPAICVDEATDPRGRKLGQPLLPCLPTCPPTCQKHRSLVFLADKRAGMSPYEWEAEYQGSPRAEGMALFPQLAVCDEMPRTGIRYAIGIDLADTESGGADWSVAVLLAAWDAWDDATQRKVTKYCVLQVARAQVLVSVFARALQLLKERYPTAPCFIFYGTQEKTVIREVLNKPVDQGGFGLNVRGLPAIASKGARATPVSAAAHANRLMVPAGNPPWLKAFAYELDRFTGTEADKHDDQVDALAAAFHVLSHRGVVVGLGDGSNIAIRTAQEPAIKAGAALLQELQQRALSHRGA